MRLSNTAIDGLLIIEIEKKVDSRGFFARVWDEKEVESTGIPTHFVQGNVSLTLKRGTLRGLHFQRPPYEEQKLVRVTRGSIYDVTVDLRSASPTYKQWVGIELTAENRTSIVVPQGCAHGFITLTDNVEVSYWTTALYTPDAQAGVRYNDPTFRVRWPIKVLYLSRKDASFPDYEEISS